MQKIKLGDVLDVKRGASLSGDYYAEEGKYVRLTLGNFNYPGGGFKENTSKSDIYFVGPIKPEFILNKGDIITPLTEQVSGLLGETATVPEGGKYIQSGDVGLVIPDETKLDKRFAYYLIASPIVKKQLDAAAQQTKIRHTSPDAIKACEAWIPEDISMQASIGRLLDDINEKIANNNTICSNLEALAKLLYDYWFVQFDFPDENGKPYKSSGGKMVWNDELKREIPAEWEVGNLYDIAIFINGLACQNYRPVDDSHKLPVIKIGEMHNGIGTNVEWARDDVPQKNIIDNGDILFSWSASLEVMLWNKGKGVLNQHIFKVVPQRYDKSYVFQQLAGYIINFVKMAEARKTTMGHITTDHLIQSRIALPPIELSKKYGEYVEGIYSKLLNCSVENEQLASLRDFLLPMLMNGQVKVGKDNNT